MWISIIILAVLAATAGIAHHHGFFPPKEIRDLLRFNRAVSATHFSNEQLGRILRETQRYRADVQSTYMERVGNYNLRNLIEEASLQIGQIGDDTRNWILRKIEDKIKESDVKQIFDAYMKAISLPDSVENRLLNSLSNTLDEQELWSLFGRYIEGQKEEGGTPTSSHRVENLLRCSFESLSNEAIIKMVQHFYWHAQKDAAEYIALHTVPAPELALEALWVFQDHWQGAEYEGHIKVMIGSLPTELLETAVHQWIRRDNPDYTLRKLLLPELEKRKDQLNRKQRHQLSRAAQGTNNIEAETRMMIDNIIEPFAQQPA